MLSLFPDLFTYREVAPFILRLVLAFIFVGHGYSKFKTKEETVKFFDSIKIKPAKFWATFVGIAELVSGAMLLVGLFTQAAAILIAVIMVVAIVKVKTRQGFLGGYEFELLILACALSLLFLGSGIFAIDLPL